MSGIHSDFSTRNNHSAAKRLTAAAHVPYESLIAKYIVPIDNGGDPLPATVTLTFVRTPLVAQVCRVLRLRHRGLVAKKGRAHMIELQVPAGALILVGDGRKALFLRNKGAPTHVELSVERVLQHADAPTREQGTDRPGRYQGSDGVSKSAFEEGC